MSCGSVQTGNHFLGAVLAQLDCQAQTIGAYGFGALADPSSPVTALLMAALIVFVALFGIRLMFGEAPGGRDVLGTMFKLGIVLTLATSWPAWRSVAYQTVLYGPAQIAGTVGSAAGLPGSNNDLNQRLDNADQGIVALTGFGTGRLTGASVKSNDFGDSARGIAVADQAGFGWGRVAFLVGTIAPLGLVRLGAGILLALAPLMAGLLLFSGTRDIFMGWLRALGACFGGAAVLGLCYGAELALLEGWLQNALAQRGADVLTPAAPTELLVMALAFAALAAGALGLVIRIMFFSAPIWQRFTQVAAEQFGTPVRPLQTLPRLTELADERLPRAHRVAHAVAEAMRREERSVDRTRLVTAVALARGSMAAAPAAAAPAAAAPAQRDEALGSSFRRHYNRRSGAALRRDGAP